MARQRVEVVAQIAELPVRVCVAEFPTIEDLLVSQIVEAMFTRRQDQQMSTLSPVGRDVKDALIKTNVVRE